jgi:hypothetical protein
MAEKWTNTSENDRPVTDEEQIRGDVEEGDEFEDTEDDLDDEEDEEDATI